MGKGARNREMHETEMLDAPIIKDNSKAKKIVMKVVLSVVAIAIVGALCWGIAYTTGFVGRNVTAITVGEQKISSLEWKMYFSDVRSELMNQMQQFGMDVTNIETQAYDETQTWGDVMKTNTISQITEIYTLYSEALANNYTMTEADNKNVESYLASFASAAETNELSEEEFIKAIYGNYVKMDDIKATVERRFLAIGYYNQKMDSFQYTDAEVEEFYNGNKDLFDVASYRSFAFPYEKVTYTAPAEGETPAEGAPKDEAEAQVMTIASMDAASTLALAMKDKITDEASFNVLSRENAAEDDKATYDSADGSLTKDTAIASATGTLGDWYKSADRKYGDKDAIDTGSAITVVYYVGRSRPSDKVVDVRHILLGTETPAETATEEEKTAIEAKNATLEQAATDLLNEWKSGDATEDSFAVLAAANSTDPGSSGNGGLYEGVPMGQMVPEFEAWMFDNSRKTGDSGIVKTTHGYHLMYYVGSSVKWQSDVHAKMVSDAYTAYFDEAKLKYEVSTNSFGMGL